MAASTITRDTWVNDTGTFAAPNGDGTSFENAVLQNHIYARIDELFAGAGAYATLTFGGLVAAEGFGAHAFHASGAGQQILSVRNALTNTVAEALVRLGNDATDGAGVLAHTSTTYAVPGARPQDGLALVGARPGGVVIQAGDAAGTIKFYTGGSTLRATFGTTGVLTLEGASVRPLIVTQAGSDSGISINSTGGSGKNYALVSTSTGEFNIQDDSDGSPLFRILGNTFQFNCDGPVFINDASNALMTKGLTINQGAADDEILALKSSDVAHGMTGATEADTFGKFDKVTATLGGLRISGFASSGSPHAGIVLHGNVSSTHGGARSTASVAPVILQGALHDGGTGLTSVGGDANLVAVRDNGTTRFVLDSDGDSHQDVGTAWTNFDTHDDVALLNGFSAALAKHGDPLRQQFGGWLRKHRRELERIKLVTFNRDGHHFVNWSRMHMVEVGAIRQLAREVVALRDRVAELEAA